MICTVATNDAIVVADHPPKSAASWGFVIAIVATAAAAAANSVVFANLKTVPRQPPPCSTFTV